MPDPDRPADAMMPPPGLRVPDPAEPERASLSKATARLLEAGLDALCARSDAARVIELLEAISAQLGADAEINRQIRAELRQIHAGVVVYIDVAREHRSRVDAVGTALGALSADLSADGAIATALKSLEREVMAR